jgi:hypothetical protein
MIPKLQQFLASIVVALLAGDALADDMPDAAAPIRVAFAVPLHHGHRTLNERKHFHVVITNVSDKPVRLWTDRFSWGYDNLSFEAIAADGSVTPIAKRPRDWTKNYPDWHELAAGETWVIDVDWFSDEGRAIWEHTPARDAGLKPMLVKLRAVYEVKPDRQSKELGVWTGKITSAEGTYAIW